MPRKAKAPSKTDVLSQVPLFSSCSRKELQKLASLADEIRIDEGRVLTNEGRPGREFFAIAEGMAKVTLRRKQLATLGPGSFFGEMSLLDHQPRAATVKAETPMTLYVMDPRRFATLLEEAPSVRKKILKELAQRVRKVEGSAIH